MFKEFFKSKKNIVMVSVLAVLLIALVVCSFVVRAEEGNCPDCGGSGANSQADIEKCPECKNSVSLAKEIVAFEERNIEKIKEVYIKGHMREKC